MSIKSRLRKLEAVAPPAPGLTFTVTEEQRGKIMRAMVLRGLRRPDPFPDVPDSESDLAKRRRSGLWTFHGRKFA